VIFNRVVSSTIEHLCDVRPLVIELPVHEEQDPLLLTTPVDFLYSWIQMVVPALTTLLSHSAREVLSDRSPSLGTVLLNKLQDAPVLLLSPRTLDQRGVASSSL